MQSNRTTALVLAALLAMTSRIAESAESPAAQAEPMPTLAPKFTPGLDDLMTLLVAPRHAKLYFAGTRRNWELATFQVKELRSSLRRIVAAMPVYLDRNLEETITALMEPALKATESAIAAGDAPRFGKAYGELTAACNACHAYLEHPFLVVKVPEASASSAYPFQEFKPTP